MKKFIVFFICIFFTSVLYAQAEQRIDITSFENSIDWEYTGLSVSSSYVVTSPSPEGAVAPDGENMLLVEYDNSVGKWNWVTLEFATNTVDLTGMREIHMWVYVVPGSVPNPVSGDYKIQLQLTGGTNLGDQSVLAAGEWHELVWTVDRLSSRDRVSNVGFFGGFFMPGILGATGTMYIDNIYAVMYDNKIELEQFLVWDFNEENLYTSEPVGWTSESGKTLLVGQGNAATETGSNYMVVTLGDGWTISAKTIDAISDFDSWPDIVEVMVDVLVLDSLEYDASWIQSSLILQSGLNDEHGNAVDAKNVNGWDIYPALGYNEATAGWKTILWEVDMSQHKGAFESEGGWLNILLSTNNDSEQTGVKILFDNFRVSVPVETGLTQSKNIF